MCWPHSHTWFYSGRTTGMHDLWKCALCGVTDIRRRTTLVVYLSDAGTGETVVVSARTGEAVTMGRPHGEDLG